MLCFMLLIFAVVVVITAANNKFILPVMETKSFIVLMLYVFVGDMKSIQLRQSSKMIDV